MNQANALYGSNDSNEPEAIGTAVTMLNDDLAGVHGWTIFQVTAMGDRGGYSVEFTLHFPEDTNPTFDKAESYEVLD